MHQGEELPLVAPETPMREVLITMTSGKFGGIAGYAGIVDKKGALIGIITDGDLRRHMRPDLMTAAVDEVMTKNPRTTTPDTLAIELLDIINSSQPRITVLIVAEGRKPVGIVHVHDVLRAGVA